LDLPTLKLFSLEGRVAIVTGNRNTMRPMSTP